MPPIKKADGTLATNSTDKANVSADQFHENHLNILANNDPTFNNEIKNVLYNFFSDVHIDDIDYPNDPEIEEYIKKKMKNTKAPGIDQLHNRLIKKAHRP